MFPRFKVKSQSSRSRGRLMLRPEVRYIFRTGRPTNFKLGTQTEHEDPHQWQAQWPPRPKVKVARSRDAYDRCWPISRERKVLETPKLVERLHTPRAIMRSSFKAKDGVRRPVSQTSAVTRPAIAETETVSYLLNRKTYKFIPCRPHSAATQLVFHALWRMPTFDVTVTSSRKFSTVRLCRILFRILTSMWPLHYSYYSWDHVTFWAKIMTSRLSFDG